jgi:hypothetical protein
MAQHPTGAPMVTAWFDCVTDACKNATTDDENTKCLADSTIAKPDAACRAQTIACFSGPAAGCKELMDAIEARCPPHAPPYSQDDFDGIISCIFALGFTATPEVQSLAWPLHACVFPLLGGDGCMQECANGPAACRACAQQKCGAQYSACLASTSGAPANTTAPADKADCQAAYTCLSSCP